MHNTKEILTWLDRDRLVFGSRELDGVALRYNNEITHDELRSLSHFLSLQKCNTACYNENIKKVVISCD